MIMYRINRIVAVLSCIFLCTFAFSQIQKAEMEEYEKFIDSEIDAIKKRISRSLSESGEKLLMQDNYDAVYYRLDLDIDIENKKIYGITTIKGRSKIEGLTSIVLDFYDNMTVNSVTANVNSHVHSDNVINVTLDKSYSYNEIFEITIEYEGTPTEEGFASFTFRTHDKDYPIVSSLSEPYLARAWWPCKDVPDDKADSADINITVPIDLIAASNGTLRRIKLNQDSTITYFWHEKYPITSYLISVAVSNYETFSHWYKYSDTDSMEVQYYVFPEDMDNENPGIEHCVEMIEVFSEKYGQYPFIEEKYGMSQFTWGGAMEHQTNSSMTNFGEMVTAHELAHQWWGDMITCKDWHNIWINEGFATYSEAVWQENKYGQSAYNSYVNYWSSRTYTGSIYINDISDVYGIFDRIVYSKAAFVLHMLRNIFGDSTFFNILSEYREQYIWSNASTEDFRDVCEQVTGEDLDWFFTQWIYGEGRPLYEYGWKYETGDTTNRVYLRLKQSQTSTTTFKMPLTIRVNYNGYSDDYEILNETRDELHLFSVKSTPSSVEIDPDNHVLKYTQLVDYDTSALDPFREIPQNFYLYQNYPNPFNEQTKIGFGLSKSCGISIRIFNVLGQEIKTVFEGFKSPGVYEIIWNGRDNSGNPVSSGMYFYTINSPFFNQTRKMIYLK